MDTGRLTAPSDPSSDLADGGRRRVIRERTWPLGLLLFTLAAAAVCTSAPGDYAADNRFDQYEWPWPRIRSWFGSWDPSRGLGAAREDVWPGTTLPLAALRGLGVPTWLTERIFHASCLALFGIGVVVLLRMVRPRIGFEHLFAALYAMFGPYAASFLIPSNLWFNVALTPWLLVALIRGTTGPHPWRWAAVFALLVFWAGNPDLPGVAAGVVLMVVTVAWSVFVGSTSWRRVGAWLLRAGAATVACSAWMLVKAALASDALAGRLENTEPVAAAATTSSWSESFRGLGNWLSYFRLRDSLLKPQGAVFFTNELVVVATFAVPVMALVGLAVSRWRPRLLFATMMVTGLVFVVGGWNGAGPFGRLFLRTMEAVPVAGAFRNTYKFAAGLVIGVGVLAGIAVTESARMLKRRGAVCGAAPYAGAVTALVLVATPFWTGSVYNPRATASPIPDYWYETLAHLDEADDGRVLVLPATSRADYRWGFVGDDIFDARLDRPHAVLTGVPRSTPLGNVALEALTRAAQSPEYSPGVVGALARRLGITTIVIRNDLRWESNDLPRPSALGPLRADPDLRLVGTFGDPGLNVTPEGAEGPITDEERTLPPVEIYAVDGAVAGPRLTTASSPLVVAGDPNSWATIHDTDLDEGSPIWHSGALSDESLTSLLDRGGAVVTTDTNRRRVRLIRSYEPWYSETLGTDVQVSRTVNSLYGTDASMSTVWYPDAVRIVGFTGSTAVASPPQDRPANAFDGDRRTAWSVNPESTSARPTVRVELREPRTITLISIDALLGTGDRSTVRSLTVEMSGGEVFDIDIGRDGRTVLAIPATTTSWFSVSIDTFDPSQPVVGLSEIALTGLDLREFVRTPTDLVDRPDEVVERIAAAPNAFAFHRVQRSTATVVPALVDRRFDDESVMRRRFVVNRPDAYGIDGTIDVLAGIPDPDLRTLLGQPVSAVALDSDSPFTRNFAAFTVDGDPETTWTSGSTGTERLEITLPETSVRSLTIHGETLGPSWGQTVRVRIGGTEQTVTIAASSTDCSRLSQGSGRPSSCRFTVEFPVVDGQVADSVGISFDGRVSRLRIAEIDIDADGPTTIDTGAVLPPTCHDVGLLLEDDDGWRARPSVRITGTVGTVLAGDPIRFASCEPVDLPGGWVTLDASSPGVSVDGLSMRTADWPTADPPVVHPLEPSDGGFRLAEGVTPPDGPSTVVVPASFDERWELSVGSTVIGPAMAVDALTGWSVDLEPGDVVEVDFGPDRTVALAAAVSSVAAFGCLLVVTASWVLQRRRRPTRPTDRVALLDPTASDAPEFFTLRRSVGALALGVGVGWAIGGTWAIGIGLLVVVVSAASGAVRPAVVAVGAPVVLGVAALTSAFSGTSGTGPLYALSRTSADDLALFAVLLTVHVIVMGWWAERRRPDVPGDDGDDDAPDSDPVQTSSATDR